MYSFSHRKNVKQVAVLVQPEDRAARDDNSEQPSSNRLPCRWWCCHFCHLVGAFCSNKAATTTTTTTTHRVASALNRARYEMQKTASAVRKFYARKRGMQKRNQERAALGMQRQTE